MTDRNNPRESGPESGRDAMRPPAAMPRPLPQTGPQAAPQPGMRPMPNMPQSPMPQGMRPPQGLRPAPGAPQAMRAPMPGGFTDPAAGPDLTALLEEQRAQAMEEYTRNPPRRGEPMYEPQPPQARMRQSMPGVGIPSSHWEQQRSGQPAMRPPQPGQPAPYRPAPVPPYAPAPRQPVMPREQAPSAYVGAPVSTAQPAYEPRATQPTQEGTRHRRSARVAPPMPAPQDESNGWAAPQAGAPRAEAPMDASAGPGRRARRVQAPEGMDGAPSYAETFAPAQTSRALNVPYPAREPEPPRPALRSEVPVPDDDPMPVDGYQVPEPRPVPSALLSIAGKRLKGLSGKAWILIGAGAAVLIALIVLLATGAFTGGSAPTAATPQNADNPYVSAPDGLAAAGQGEAPVGPWNAAQPTEEPPAATSDGPQIYSFAADPAAGQAPLTVTFTLTGNDRISSLKLLTASGDSLSTTLQSMPTADGIEYTFTTRFEAPYTGPVRVYLRDRDGQWSNGALTCDVDIQ